MTQYIELTKVKSPAVLRYTRACTFIHVHNKSTASLSSILTKRSYKCAKSNSLASVKCDKWSSVKINSQLSVTAGWFCLKQNYGNWIEMGYTKQNYINFYSFLKIANYIWDYLITVLLQSYVWQK